MNNKQLKTFISEFRFNFSAFFIFSILFVLSLGCALGSLDRQQDKIIQNQEKIIQELNEISKQQLENSINFFEIIEK